MCFGSFFRTLAVNSVSDFFMVNINQGHNGQSSVCTAYTGSLRGTLQYDVAVGFPAYVNVLVFRTHYRSGGGGEREFPRKASCDKSRASQPG